MNNFTKQQWEKSLDEFPESNFLQSWAWGEFHQKLGQTIYRVISKNWMFQAIVEPAKRARYLTVPGGPLVQHWDQAILREAVSSMRTIAKRDHCAFIRIRPQVFDTPENRSVIQEFGFRPAPMHLHAELTRILDLTKSDEQLLSEMRKGTRYEIRKAQKMGIHVEQSSDEKLIDEFMRLQQETAEREQFVPFSKSFLLEQFRAFRKESAVKWFYVERIKRLGLDNSRPSLHTISKIISMAFVLFYHHEAVYHYAASSEEARHIPAAYALQWAIIQEAKKRGCTTYNLWGDVPDDKLSKHRFAGPSLFKRGFGGQQVAYLHAHDLPLSKKYWINWIIEQLRKKSRAL